MKQADVIVVGVGSMGASTCWHLARNGVRVIGIEQHTIPHDRGSHTGQTRLIRKAYFEHSDYVPLLQAAYKGWDELERVSGARLFEQTGIAYMGPVSGPLIKGVQHAASRYSIPVKLADSSTSPFEKFTLPDSFQCLWEHEAGFVRPEATIRSYARLAREEGATLHSQTAVLNWAYTDGHVVVHTDRETFRADRLIFTTGAYTTQLLETFVPNLKVTQQLLAWFEPADPSPFYRESFPCWIAELPDEPGIFYGFPHLEEDQDGPSGMKVAYHHPGPEIDPALVLSFDAKHEIERLNEFLRTYLPSGMGEVVDVRSCLYTNSPDSDFIIDFVGDTDEKVIVATGFSGHGYKFVPVIGEILADLAVRGETEHPISFLRSNRLRL